MFMSAEHVDAMNRILALDDGTRAACAKLPRPYWFVHELDDHGATVWWTLEFNPQYGARFSLAPPPEGVRVDILMRGAYRAVVEATRRGKAGEKVPYPATLEGDVQAMEMFGPALEAARRAATLETQFP